MDAELNPETTTLGREEYYELICAQCDQLMRNGEHSDPLGWALRLMDRYNKFHGGA